MSVMIDLDPVQVACVTLHDEGCTVALDGTVPTTGYAVALADREEQHHLHGGVVADMEASRDAVAGYVAEHLDALTEPGHFLGTWVDGQVLFLDVVKIIHGREEAVRVGKINKQLAIFHLDTGETVTL